MSNCSSCSGENFASLGGYREHLKGTVNENNKQGYLPQKTHTVPQYRQNFGYEALTHGDVASRHPEGSRSSGCEGSSQYYTIQYAYPAYNKNCDGFTQQACPKSQ